MDNNAKQRKQAKVAQAKFAPEGGTLKAPKDPSYDVDRNKFSVVGLPAEKVRDVTKTWDLIPIHKKVGMRMQVKSG